ncbi:clustered mitochondria protein homolog [Oryzias melastigma]|uniref:Clustered mitochondria (cluA/CLU1) homolog b n=1 Tax=Oryzias melastigma TaxID=30732 RepID=A0A3B3BR79_ORYME|nr:clustered mitochondria protein homolog [Oryzias melastigma]XP_024122381.1 clustered mitochondria protein homolog [Oryzias melastigma]
MGNFLQCCQTLSNYCKWQNASAQRGGEQSNLLSSDGSESETPSDSHTLEDDPLTASTGITNPALEPDHFLFPDIILSSNPGGEVTLVEPMVCLLVSEEEDGLRLMEHEKGDGERGQRFSEVETLIGMGVQTETKTQAEDQTQTEMLKSDEGEERERNKEKNEETKPSEIKTEQKLEENINFPVRWEDSRLQMSDLNTSGSLNHQSADPSTSGQAQDSLLWSKFTNVQQSFLEEDDEEGSGMKQGPLLFLDKLFPAAAHGKVAESYSDDPLDPCHEENRNNSVLRDIHDLQDPEFTCRIQAPGAETFDLQVSAQMLVSELQQALMDHEVTCHRTCFSLQLEGATLDSGVELRSIQGVQDGALIKVVEDSYSIREARLHLRHVSDLLRSLGPADSFNGVNGSSLSYLSCYTRRGQEREKLTKKQAFEREPDCSPPDYILPGCKEPPVTPLQPVRDDWKPLQCLRVLSLSGWNPPPGNRRMHGDLMYINVLTLEDKELNITSSTRGFYCNQSTAFIFNPKPSIPKILCHSLVELLNQLSPAFKKNFSALQKKRAQQHLYERVAAPFQLFTWIAPHGDHTLECVRAEESPSSHMGQDELTAGQSRDWNEELQGCRELRRGSLQERLHRERSIFKIISDFVAAATQGAIAVIDGNVMPLNPREPPHLQMFVWNNLFFSQGFDLSDHYKPLGGDTAAHAAAVCDLRGVQAYTSVDTEGLHNLGTAVVDYRGVRVVAQTIIPGILEKNHEQIVYGSNDNGKTVFTHPRFLELLSETSKPLRIQHHQVLDHNNRPAELCSGITTIGLFGNDRRPYVLDLLRTFPPDLNFQFSEGEVTGEELPDVCKSFGYPCRHRHRLASLRPELIDAFVQHRYELFVKIVSEELEKQEKATERSAGDAEQQRRAAVQKACTAVGSVSDSCFDVRFNPNVCSPGVTFPSECVEELHSQRQLLWSAAAFLLSEQIPAALRDCLDHTANPMDGASLTAVLHQRGVNVRYLGSVLMKLDMMEEKVRLRHVQRISISEVIVRSAKHIFRTYLQDVKPADFSVAVSHFLNCLLTSSCSSLSDGSSNELPSHRRSRRRRGHSSRVSLTADSVWARLTSSRLWGRIRAEAEDYYKYAVESESLEEVIEKHNLQRISLLREFAIKTGIQVQLREYAFESRQKAAFVEDDVINMFPVVKRLRPTSSDATQLLRRARLAAQEGHLRYSHDLITQALTLFSRTCGVLHEDVCTCLRLLGRLSYVFQDVEDAVRLQEKAVMISERIQGIDHPQTIEDYTYLALYCFAGGQHSTSLQLLYRARYLTLLVSGENHPHVALLDNMLGLVLYGLMKYELSLKFLQNALNLTSKFHGLSSLKHAHCHRLLTAVYESKGDLLSALQHEKEAYSIYRSQVGMNHTNTKECSEHLKSLNQQVALCQKVDCSEAPSACNPPPELHTLSAVLQQLNVLCGFDFPPLSKSKDKKEENKSS